MAKIEIDKDKCKGCMLCVSVCPKKLIVRAKKLNAKGVCCVEFSAKGECTGCSMCALMCPEVCIEISK